MAIKRHKKEDSSFGQILAVLSLFFVFLIVPIYLENQYFNVTEAKAHIVWYGGSFLVFLGIISFFTERKKTARIRSCQLIDISVYLFAFAVLVSWLLSGHLKETFFGSQGWYTGAFVCFICIAFYVLIVRHFSYSQQVWLPMMIVHAVLLLIGILHSAGIDVFDLHKGIILSEYFDYISTYGQKNQFSGILCLLFPAFAYFFLSVTDRRSEWIYLVFLFLLCFGIVICGSDSIFLGLAAAVLFLVPVAFQKQRSLEKGFLLIALFGLTLLLFRLLPFFAWKRSYYDGVFQKVLTYQVSVLMLLSGCAGCFLTRRFYDRVPEHKRRLIVRFLVGIVCIGIIAVIILQIFRFNEGWGSRRGEIWICAVNDFQNDFTFKEKMIGAGPDQLKPVFTALSAERGELVISPHSMPLYMLLCYGLCGIALMLLFLIGFIKSVFDNVKRKTDNAFTASIAAFLGWMLINTWNAQTAAFFAIFLALYRVAGNALRER